MSHGMWGVGVPWDVELYCFVAGPSHSLQGAWANLSCLLCGVMLLPQPSQIILIEEAKDASAPARKAQSVTSACCFNQ